MARKRHSPESIAKVLRKPSPASRSRSWRAKPAFTRTRSISGRRDTARSVRLRFAKSTSCVTKTRGSSAGRRPDARQGDASGCALKKALKPAKQRGLVGELRSEYGVKPTAHLPNAAVQSKVRSSTNPRSAPSTRYCARIKELSQARVRYGYRRIHVLLRREGWKVNPKRIARLYRQEGLSLRAKGTEATSPVRSAASSYRGDATESRLEHGFHARSFDGRGPQGVPFADHRRHLYARMPGTRSRHGLSGTRRRCSASQAPCRPNVERPIAIRCDQGTEFTAEALDQWAYNNRIELDFSRPGKPTDNASPKRSTPASARNCSTRPGLIL